MTSRPLAVEQRRRVRALFEAALDQAPADLPRWLEEAASDDADVRAEVRSLLDHHSRAGSFLTQPIVESAPHLLQEEHTLEPGTVLGAYTIVRELGRGGMGRVYLASDSRLGRTVALKALAPQLTREAHHRERFRTEARAAAVLTHPGICTVYALEELEGELYIATEFVDGQTLREELSTGEKPSLDTIIATARELASALASAHAKGISHRDLKPENVMRTPERHIKILDFGLARIETPGGGAGTLTAAMPGALVGTPAYMAPEQIEGRATGPATDVFAFGVLMYEWISRRHPFAAGSPLATLARVVDSTPEPLATRTDVPRWLSDVIDRCLRKASADRFASGSDLQQAFEHPAVAARPAPGARTWWRTHQIAVIVLYAVATAHAWQIKEWIREPVPLWAFVLMGIAGSVGGIVRGHLVFTEVMNRLHLNDELRRTQRTRLLSDMAMAALLTIDALLLASMWPLTTVLTISLAAGIAIAAILMEPATTVALLGD